MTATAIALTIVASRPRPCLMMAIVSGGSPAAMRASPQMTAGWAATADGPARICPPRADPSARTASENTDVAGYCSAMGYRPPTAIGTYLDGTLTPTSEGTSVPL